MIVTEEITYSLQRRASLHAHACGHLRWGLLIDDRATHISLPNHTQTYPPWPNPRADPTPRYPALRVRVRPVARV